MRLRRFIVLLALLAMGCGTVIMSQPVEQSAKGWTIALRQVKDGPNSYARGDNVHYVPPDGARFLWFTLSIRNDEASPRTFNYDRCDLDLGDDKILPALVDMDMAINATADDEEELKSGERVSRLLAFAYPEGRLPTRLSCGEVVIQLALDG